MIQQATNAAHVEYPSRIRALFLILGSLLFVVAGIWMIQSYLSGEDTIVTALVGVVCILFFGIALLFSIVLLFKRTPTLQLDEEGIIDNSSLIPGGRIRWDEISEIQLYSYKGQPFIGINLNKPDDYLAEQSVINQQLMRVNKGLVQAHVNIGRQGISSPLPELYEEMKRRWLAATTQETRL